MTAPVLRFALPGVVSWARPRRYGGITKYPKAYERDRAAWATVVAYAVAQARWVTPGPETRLMVNVLVWGGGKRDIDRVGTAVLDALQGGAAIKDDCLVDHLTLIRYPAPSAAARVELVVRCLDGGGRAPDAPLVPWGE